MAQDLTTLKTIEQGRATYAFEAVSEISKNGDKGSKKLKDNYKSAAKNTPVLIKTNGLGQTLAFMKSKSGTESGKGYEILYEQIGTWLQTKDVKGLVSSEVELVLAVIELESPVYRQVTIETLALLNWMRRFVDGLIKDEVKVSEMEGAEEELNEEEEVN